MTQLVTVQTDFRDLEQMAQGLVGRVHETHLILPTGESVDEGEWAQFEITLFDGQSGLAGVGRCVTLVDNGDERLPHQRFDLVLDSLQFDTHEQSVFEHILALHGVGGAPIEDVSGMEAESLPPANDDSFVDDDGAELSGEDAVSVAPDASEPTEDEHTMIASADELSSLSEPPSVHIPPGGEANDVVPHTPPARAPASGGSYGVATRGNAAHAVHPLLDELEEPLSGERIAPTRQPLAGGVFAYTNGIVFPKKPPRPDLDATLRVTPAPRPTRPHH